MIMLPVSLLKVCEAHTTKAWYSQHHDTCNAAGVCRVTET